MRRTAALSLTLSLSLVAALAHADGYRFRKLTTTPGATPADAMRVELARQLQRAAKPGPALKRQLARIDGMLQKPGVSVVVGTWASPHVGTGTVISPDLQLSVANPTVIGVFDPETKLVRGINVTDAGELIGVTIRTGTAQTIAVRDGASPLIGAARHVAAAPPEGTAVLRAFNRPDRSSVAHETRYVKGQAPARRTHAVAWQQGGVIDAGPEYQTMRDAHTGRVLTDGYRTPARESAPGVDPWQGD